MPGPGNANWLAVGAFLLRASAIVAPLLVWGTWETARVRNDLKLLMSENQQLELRVTALIATLEEKLLERTEDRYTSRDAANDLRYTNLRLHHLETEMKLRPPPGLLQTIDDHEKRIRELETN